VLFSGGRGSSALTRQLIANPAIDLTLAINGYDDGASTGEVRRFLGDSLGPSDFRKNASTLAAALRTCLPALVELLDLRFPVHCAAADAHAAMRFVSGDPHSRPGGGFGDDLARLVGALEYSSRARIGARLLRFADEVTRSGRPFNFSDCSLGNLVFAGGFLLAGRRFNTAVDEYCALLGLAAGLIENVTDGTNAWLIALDDDGRLLATEEAIVDVGRPNRIREIYLVDRPLTAPERALAGTSGAGADALLSEREAVLPINRRLVAKIAGADLIIYAPGTQHSSLFPSYLTTGIAEVIAGNLAALKVLVTNIQTDAEISGSSAVDLVRRAAYYLTNKGRARLPTPFLITHSLINDPNHAESATPYVPLGPTEAIEDPRLVRIGNFEDGVSGRHDAARILAPIIASFTGPAPRPQVAVLLHGAGSTNKIAQTLLEMVRGGVADVPVEVTVFHPGPEALDPSLAARLPFALCHLPAGIGGFADAARGGTFDYVLLFESSGMYRGEEIVPLLSQLANGRLDAVWGSRRLSVRDIEESYRFRYERNALAGTISRIGSHVLSLACLGLYGRFVTDTLSGVRAVRASDVFETRVDLTRRGVNHVLLAALLRRKAEILEVPVRFFPLSPDRVTRTTAWDGLRDLGILVARRFSPTRPAGAAQGYAADAPAPLRSAK
jgi:2-phospho-L-lactate transferase/gluconeogenesis factor (CofD/UPF0052 family)